MSKPTITLSKERGELVVRCTDPKLRNNCSFVRTPGVGERGFCVKSSAITGIANVNEESSGLLNEAQMKDVYCR